METQKIVNLLNGSDNENSKFATKEWYVVDSESKGIYSHENPIKFLASSSESSLCHSSDAYILVTGNIIVTGGDANTRVAFKHCAPFKECRTEINEAFVNDARHINIAMPMYNLIEYSDNYSDTSGSLWKLELLLILPQKILHHLNANQILLGILLHMEQTEKSRVQK